MRRRLRVRSRAAPRLHAPWLAHDGVHESSLQRLARRLRQLEPQAQRAAPQQDGGQLPDLRVRRQPQLLHQRGYQRRLFGQRCDAGLRLLALLVVYAQRRSKHGGKLRARVRHRFGHGRLSGACLCYTATGAGTGAGLCFRTRYDARRGAAHALLSRARL